MFYPKDNPGYYALSEQAKALIVAWTTDEWYESSTGESFQLAIEDEHEDENDNEKEKANDNDNENKMEL